MLITHKYNYTSAFRCIDLICLLYFYIFPEAVSTINLDDPNLYEQVFSGPPKGARIL